MYSVVLLVALSGGAEAPAADCGGGGCNGGCHGGRLFGGHGCHGGLFSGHGCHGGLFSGHGCHGCNGGSSCDGCHGGHRLFGGHGCHGYSSCNGGCHGGCHGGLFRRHGCHGCNGCYGSGCNGSACSGAVICNGSAGCSGAVAPATAPAPAPKEMPKPKAKEANISAPATIIVSLPAEAQLKVDDYVTTSTSATRMFVSPTLNAGTEYTYTLTGEIVREGKSVVASKRITVRAGEETRVNLEFPTTIVAAE